MDAERGERLMDVLTWTLLFPIAIGIECLFIALARSLWIRGWVIKIE